MLKRVLVFAYGLVCYAIFLATFLYALGFVGNFVVPATLDGVPRLRTGQALAIDIGLLGALRPAAQRDGAPVLQALAHRFDPRARRTQHLRAVLQPRVDR